MQRRVWKDQNLKSYKNNFCDSEKSAIFEFMPLEKAIDICSDGDKLGSLFTSDELLELNRYAVLKNLKADVKELTLYSLRPDLAAQALEEFGFFGKVVINIKDILTDKFGYGRSLTKPLKLIEKLKINPKICPCIYIDNLLDYTDSQLSMLSQIANENDCSLYISFLRSLDEAGSLDKIYNRSPARVLEDFGFLDKKAYLVGCNFLDKDDAEIASRFDAELIISPVADMILGRGAINLVMLLKSGLDISLGSDISPTVDMLQEGLIAIGNTANMMYDPFAVTRQQMEDMIASDKDVDELLTEVRFNKQQEKIREIFRRKD